MKRGHDNVSAWGGRARHSPSGRVPAARLLSGRSVASVQVKARRPVQELNVSFQEQKSVLPYEKVADMSLAAEALKLLR